MFRPSSQHILSKDIARLLQADLIGASDILVSGLSSLNEAGSQDITFIKKTTLSRAKVLLQETNAGIILLQSDILNDLQQPKVSQCLIGVQDPQRALLSILQVFYEESHPGKGIHPSAVIAPSAKVHSLASIGPFVFVGPHAVVEEWAIIHPHVCLYEGAFVGKNSIIHSGAIIREWCKVGERCTIQNGAVIGADGFGYIPNEEGKLELVPQVGRTILGDDVDIGANSCVDRASLGATIIGDGTKIDNQVQIGHNVHIGKSSIICGQVGIAGSSKIGDGVVLGGQSGVADHIEISSKIRVGAKSAVFENLTKPGDYIGIPAIPAGAWRRMITTVLNISKSKSTSVFRKKEEH